MGRVHHRSISFYDEDEAKALLIMKKECVASLSAVVRLVIRKYPLDENGDVSNSKPGIKIGPGDHGIKANGNRKNGIPANSRGKQS